MELESLKYSLFFDLILSKKNQEGTKIETHPHKPILQGATIHVLPSINDTGALNITVSHFVSETGKKVAQLLREGGCFSQVSYGCEQTKTGRAVDYTLQLYVKKISGNLCDWGFELYDQSGVSILSEANQASDILTHIMHLLDSGKFYQEIKQFILACA